jgi:hypothetical protein
MPSGCAVTGIKAHAAGITRRDTGGGDRIFLIFYSQALLRYETNAGIRADFRFGKSLRLDGAPSELAPQRVPGGK